MKHPQPFASGVRCLERSHHLGQHPLLLARIARREVKRLDAADIGLSRNVSCSRGRQMGALPRQRGVGVRKSRLNEEDVRILNQRHDGGTIGRRVCDIGHIGNFLAGSDRQDITQAAEWNEAIRSHRSVDWDQMIIGAALNNRLLERAQPRPDGQPALQQPVLPEIDMRRLLQRKGEAGCPVFKDRG